METDEGKVAYDERFHHGINIIRGENSSGKSTITHLLFYALGGDYTQFVSEARRCQRVWVEIDINGAVLTLSRPIEKDMAGKVLSQRGMTIYWGSIDAALQSACRANIFGYKATDGKSSFSNILFEAMNIPIVQSDSNITMHQLLRLMYIDQESPTASLFYYEQFDRQTTRETIADLLLGIFDQQLYAAKLKLKELEDAIDEAKANIRALETSLKPEMRSTSFIHSIIDERNHDMELIAEKIELLKQGDEAEKQKKTTIDVVKAEVRRLEKECEQQEEAIDLLEHDIEDTQMFVDELSRRQQELHHSADTRTILGSLQIEYCPECLSPLPKHTPEGTCHLCHQPITGRANATEAQRLIAEISFQKQESANILHQDKDKLMKAKAKLKSLRAKRKTARANLDVLLCNVRSSRAEAVEDLIFRKGQIDGELMQYYTMLEMAERYEQLVDHKNQLERDTDATQRLIRAHTARQFNRRSAAMAKIQEHGAYFLNHDEMRQKNFYEARPEDFMVDYANNIVFLQDRYAKYSASSAFFLKLVARFALFFASLDIEWMRYPHFIFADNMEDKGIELSRAQHFQRTLIAHLSHYDADKYQVIYTTSYIPSELDNSPYVVGENYDINNKSLKNV